MTNDVSSSPRLTLSRSSSLSHTQTNTCTVRPSERVVNAQSPFGMFVSRHNAPAVDQQPRHGAAGGRHQLAVGGVHEQQASERDQSQRQPPSADPGEQFQLRAVVPELCAGRWRRRKGAHISWALPMHRELDYAFWLRCCFANYFVCVHESSVVGWLASRGSLIGMHETNTQRHMGAGAQGIVQVHSTPATGDKKIRTK